MLCVSINNFFILLVLVNKGMCTLEREREREREGERERESEDTVKFTVVIANPLPW